MQISAKLVIQRILIGIKLHPVFVMMDIMMSHQLKVVFNAMRYALDVQIPLQTATNVLILKNS